MEKKKANCEVRAEAKKAGVTLWQIAMKLGVSEATINRLFRCELSEADRERVLSAIEAISAEQEG